MFKPGFSFTQGTLVSAGDHELGSIWTASTYPAIMDMVTAARNAGTRQPDRTIGSRMVVIGIISLMIFNFPCLLAHAEELDESEWLEREGWVIFLEKVETKTERHTWAIEMDL